jgi:O-antigen ligase
VAGTGLGSFEKRYKESLTPSEQRKVRVIISHNAPVTVLTEGGAIGFALFLFLVVMVAVRIGADSRAPDPEGWATWAILAMLAGILVHSLLYSALFEDPYTWVLVGAAVGLAGGRRTHAEAPEAQRPPQPVPVA